MNRHFIVPYLMGQWRDGLQRVREMDGNDWDVVRVPEFDERTVANQTEQMRRMGKIYHALADAVQAVASSGEVPVSISGDCVSSLGMLGGLQKAGKSPDRILWLDAHGDFHTWGTSQSLYIGGMPLAILVGRKDRRTETRDAIAAFVTEVGVRPYPESQVLLSDARDLDPGEEEALLASAIVRCRIDQVLEHLNPDQSVYLHWDTDVLDAAAEMPALKYHVDMGPSCATLRALFRRLGALNIVAVSVSAWHEEQDKDNRTASMCLGLLSELGLGQTRC